MLSFKNRFHGHGSLRYVYKNGQAERTHLVTLKHVPNMKRKQSRVAVVISKKVVKSAVGRNRARRRVYEIVRRKLPNIVQPTDMVFLLFSHEVVTMPHDELEQLIEQLIQSANLYKKPL